MFFVKIVVIEGCPVIAVFYRDKVRALFLCGRKRKLRAMARVLLEVARWALERAEALRSGS
jgi:hypothetical protein